MPIGFIGHGSPMTALEKDGAPALWTQWAKAMPKPRAVVMVSAHWIMKPVHIGPNQTTPLIYDFYGFPDELYDARYEAPGSAELSKEVFEALSAADLKPIESHQRGLDHGAWAPLIHLYPQADVPVIQVSIGTRVPAAEHIALGRALAPLREKGILIMGSGNITHNLRAANFGHREAPPVKWAKDFDDWVADKLVNFDLEALAHYTQAPGARFAVPTDDHYSPLLIVAAAASVHGTPQVKFPIEGFEYESLSMRCVEFN